MLYPDLKLWLVAVGSHPHDHELEFVDEREAGYLAFACETCGTLMSIPIEHVIRERYLWPGLTEMGPEGRRGILESLRRDWSEPLTIWERLRIEALG